MLDIDILFETTLPLILALGLVELLVLLVVAVITPSTDPAFIPPKLISGCYNHKPWAHKSSTGPWIPQDCAPLHGPNKSNHQLLISNSQDNFISGYYLLSKQPESKQTIQK